MEINQIYKAPSIPKLSRRTIKSSVFFGANKSGLQMNKTRFSFIQGIMKPKTIDPSSISQLVPDQKGKNFALFAIDKSLSLTNRILVEVKRQLDFEHLSRIAAERNQIEKEKKRISRKKVTDKEKSIESGGIREQTKIFNRVVEPIKDIFRKIIDFFSIILTGLVLNNVFNWLSKKENQEKVKLFFHFLVDHWKEILIILGTAKLLRLLLKVVGALKSIKGLVDLFKKKPPGPNGPCGCDDKPPKGPKDPCSPIVDCIKSGGPKVEEVAEKISKTQVFQTILTGLGVKPPARKPPIKPPSGVPRSPRINPPTRVPQQTPWYNTPLAQTLGYSALGLGLSALTIAALISPFEGPTGEIVAGTQTLGAFGKAGQALRMLRGFAKTGGAQASGGAGQVARGAQSVIGVNNAQNSIGQVIRFNYPSGGAGQVASNNILRFNRNLIPTNLGRSIGGTVGKGDKPGRDTVPAFIRGGSRLFLDPDEEVINAKQSRNWRPTLKDINDNGARMWMQFVEAIKKQETTNTSQTENNKRFGKVLEQYEKYVDDEKKRLEKKYRDYLKKLRPSGNGGGGGGGGTPPSGGGGGGGGGNVRVGQVVGGSSSGTTANPATAPTEDPRGTQPPATSSTGIPPQPATSSGGGQIPRQVIPFVPGSNSSVSPEIETRELIVPSPKRIGQLTFARKKPTITCINMPANVVDSGLKPGSIPGAGGNATPDPPSISSTNPLRTSHLAHTLETLGVVLV